MVGTGSAAAYDPRAAVRRGVDLARATYAQLDEGGHDRLGRARVAVHGGSGSWFNRISRVASIGVGSDRATGPNGRLVTIETTIHELTHKWMDGRAKGVGLVYAGSPGRLSEGLSQVMAGVALGMHGTPEERAHAWDVLDPRTQTTPVRRMGGTVDVPLSVTMDDVRGQRMTFTDNGLVHVHRGVVQEGHRLIARDIGMEDMGRLTVETAHARLHPLMGIHGWARATVDTGARLFGAGSAQANAIQAAWQAAKVLR